LSGDCTIRIVLVTTCLVALVACGQIQSGVSENAPGSGRFLPLLNTGFEDGDTQPAGWLKGASVDGVEYIWQKTVGHEGNASLCIKKTAERYFPVAQWHETVAHTDSARNLRVKAWVKAEQVYKAVLDVQFVDYRGKWQHKSAAYIGAREPGDRPADHDWHLYSGTVALPVGTERISVALQMYGPGTVWFDDVSAEYIESRYDD